MVAKSSREDDEADNMKMLILTCLFFFAALSNSMSLEECDETMNEELNKRDEQIDAMKKIIERLESTLQKAEQDKQSKDNQIETLSTELARQEETIGKLKQDKKSLEETIKKTQSDLAAEEDKVNQLNKLKQNLEATIDEVCNVKHLSKACFLN